MDIKFKFIIRCLCNYYVLVFALLIASSFSTLSSADKIFPESGSDGKNQAGIERSIMINLPAFKLYVLDNGRIARTFQVRIGSGKYKTNTGNGYVSKKFNPSYFRYFSGENAGEIIKNSRIREYLNGPVIKTIKIPYKRVRGLELRINGRVSGQIIHATTNPETLGYSYSRGCIGLGIDDMLELYQMIPAKTKVRILYEPVELIGDTIHIYDDVYNRDYDYVGRLSEIFQERQINYSTTDIKKLLAAVNQRSVKVFGLKELDRIR